MTRVVCDANVWISALLFKGDVAELVDLMAANPEYEVLISPPLLSEIEEALLRPKFRLDRRIITALMEEIRGRCTLVNPPPGRPVVVADPDDDRVLECAVEGKAGWVVSGDAHLLRLREHKEISIVTPGDMLRRITERQNDK